MGRAEWLAGNLQGGLSWMERSVTLSPNYAFAIYNSALVGTMLGEGKTSEARVTKAIALSPIDPLGYAMLATRALSQWVQGDRASAAEWSERAVQAPNAHVHIFAIAAIMHELAGEREKAQSHLKRVQQARPDYRIEDFLRSFPMSDRQRGETETALRRLGL
jgi:tetratricopeptide (TPR) repeat protein